MTKNTRKTANDYREEYRELQRDIESLKARIGVRLLELCRNNPDAPIDSIWNTVIKASSLDSPNYINSIDIEAKLKYINTIEKYIQSKFSHVQIQIDNKFNYDIL